MIEKDPKNPALNRVQGMSLLIGAACAAAAVAGAFPDWPRFINAYLIGFLFVLGLSLGSMAMVMMHHMMGGDYAYLTRRIFESGAMCMPVVTILFIPIAMGAPHLFPYAIPEVVKADPVLSHQAPFMSWWLIRAAIYFAIWNIIAIALWAGSSSYDRTANPWTVVRMRRVSAIGLLLYVVTMSFATVDWIMIREMHWYSSILGLVICVSQVLGSVVVAISVLRFLRYTPSIGNYMTGPHLNDLGNVFLTFTILWAYMSFAQLLIIWMGNIATETPWYVRRGLGGFVSTQSFWRGIALLLLVAHFFIPFFILLARSNKRNIQKLSTLAMFVVVMRAVDVFWWAGPTSLDPKYVGPIQINVNGILVRAVTWVDLVTVPAMFFIWLFVMLFLLKLRPALAHIEHGPELDGGLNNGGAHRAHPAA